MTEGSSCRLVALGSLNPVKLRGSEAAFRLAGLCARLEQVSIEGVPPQPVGLEETVRLACLRAERAMRALGTEEGLGVEAGLVNVSDRWLVVNAACYVGPWGSSVGLAPSFEVPGWAAERAAKSELDRVVEEVTGAHDMGSSVGLIGMATKGLVAREDLVRWAVLMAIVGRSVSSLLGR